MSLTYGEAWYQSKMSIKQKRLFEVDANNIRIKQNRMKREEASRYYNKKLFDYWISKLDSRVRDEHKKKLLSALMFNSTDAYKKKIGV